MDMYLDNVGIIKNSTIKIEGLTIITGENCSGKSIIGKALYSVISATEKINEDAFIDKKKYLSLQITEIMDMTSFFYFFRAINKLDKLAEIAPTIAAFMSSDLFDYKSPNQIINALDELKSELEELLTEDGFVKISGILNDKIAHKSIINELQSKREDDIKRVLHKIDGLKLFFIDDPQAIIYSNNRIIKSLNTEFYGQLSSQKDLSNKTSRIVIKKNNDIYYNILIEDDKPKEEKFFFKKAFSNAFFIDDIYAIDLLSQNYNQTFNSYTPYRDRGRNFEEYIITQNHNDKLIKAMKKESDSLYQEIKNKNKTENILKSINSVLPDSIVFSNGRYECDKSKLDVRNLATGLKMFAIIKTLMENGSLTENTLLILDEPKSHLHPAWQNIFAEITVLLVKEIGVKIVLTTHSSNFLLALDVYKRKHQIDDITHFYSTVIDQKGEAIITNIDDSVGKAYASMGKPFLDMEKEYRELQNDEESGNL